MTKILSPQEMNELPVFSLEPFLQAERDVEVLEKLLKSISPAKYKPYAGLANWLHASDPTLLQGLRIFTKYCQGTYEDHPDYRNRWHLPGIPAQIMPLVHFWFVAPSLDFEINPAFAVENMTTDSFPLVSISEISGELLDEIKHTAEDPNQFVAKLLGDKAFTPFDYERHFARSNACWAQLSERMPNHVRFDFAKYVAELGGEALWPLLKEAASNCLWKVCNYEEDKPVPKYSMPVLCRNLFIESMLLASNQLIMKAVRAQVRKRISEIKRLEAEDPSYTNDVRALKSLAQTTEILEILETLNKCKAQIESVVSGITKNSLNKSSIDLLSESMKEFVSKRAVIKQHLNKHYVKK